MFSFFKKRKKSDKRRPGGSGGKEGSGGGESLADGRLSRAGQPSGQGTMGNDYSKPASSDRDPLTSQYGRQDEVKEAAPITSDTILSNKQATTTSHHSTEQLLQTNITQSLFVHEANEIKTQRKNSRAEFFAIPTYNHSNTEEIDYNANKTWDIKLNRKSESLTPKHDYDELQYDKNNLNGTNCEYQPVLQTTPNHHNKNQVELNECANNAKELNGITVPNQRETSEEPLALEDIQEEQINSNNYFEPVTGSLYQGIDATSYSKIANVDNCDVVVESSDHAHQVEDVLIATMEMNNTNKGNDSVSEMCFFEVQSEPRVPMDAESESIEKCVNSDENNSEPNENKDEKSVRDGEVAAAKCGVSARFGDSGRGDGRTSGDMERVASYPLESHLTEGLKGDLPLYPRLKEADPDRELCEGGSSSDQTDSEEDERGNVVKNDSGCWDEPEGPERLSPAIQMTNYQPILFLGDWRTRRPKKYVKWADTDGEGELIRAKEESPVSSEGEGDTEEEEEVGGVKDDETDSDEDEESSDSEEEEEEEEDEDEEENKEKAEPTIKLETPPPIEKSSTRRDGTWLEGSEEEDEDDDEEDECAVDSKTSVVRGEMTEVQVDAKCEGSDDSSDEDDEEEYESEQEDSSEADRLKNEEPPTIRIDVVEMQRRIAELQNDISNKTSNIDRLQIELDTACHESELVRQRFKKLESDLESYRRTNQELTERLHITEILEDEKILRSTRQLSEAEQRIKSLEAELEEVKQDYSNLQTSYKKLQADRNMEVQIIQKALEKALTDQEEMENKYEKEFENLRTLNSGREVQMLEDFEWKLREVERNCKKKIQDYETEYEQKNIILAGQLAAAQADLEQISHLKLCEIELNQLKQTSSEQRKNLRSVNRKLEELQVSEKILQEEVNSLRSSLDKEKAHIVALQTMHKEELAEKDRKMKIKMEVQIKQMSHEWEERLRNESYKIKTEMEKAGREEKRIAVDTANKLKDQEITQLNQIWEKKQQDFKNEIAKHKNKISELQEYHKYDLNSAQTNADRDLIDLRRKMDKLDMSYQEKIEKIQEQHEGELAAVKEEWEKRVEQMEASLLMQASNSRTTLQLVKEQLTNEGQARLEALENEYQRKLENQRLEIEKEKELALAKLEDTHRSSIESLHKELERIKKQARNEQEKLARRRNQQEANQPGRLNGPTNRVAQQDNGVPPRLISTRIDVAEVGEEIRRNGKEEVLQRSIEQLTKQLNAGKMEIEKLRQELEGRGQRHQGKNGEEGPQQRGGGQQPVPNPRRNRKGRSGRN